MGASLGSLSLWMLVLGLLPGAWLLPVLVLPVPWLGLALQILPGWRGAPRTRPARVQPLALLCAGTLLVIAINTLSKPLSIRAPAPTKGLLSRAAPPSFAGECASAV